MKFCWATALVVMLLQLKIDHAQAIVAKPDWRGASHAIVEQGIHADRDVVFFGETGSEFGRGMVFRVSPHYWPTNEHALNLLRDRDRFYNNGRPILDRANCRVALMARTSPGAESFSCHTVARC